MTTSKMSRDYLEAVDAASGISNACSGISGVPMAEPEYAELHCWSNFSFLEGASHPEELVDHGRHLGLRGIALTDRDGLYGAVRFAKYAAASGSFAALCG